jgi:hypothetical protein
MLQVFAIVIFACAVAAEYLSTIFERLHSHVDVARAEAEYGQDFWTTLIEQVPLPVMLVDSDTSNTLCASKQASSFFNSEPVIGRSLFEIIHFSYPEIVQELITGAGGVAPLSMIRIKDRLRTTEVHVNHLAHKGRRFALVVIQDKTEEFTSQAALDVSGQAVLAIDSRGRLVAFNQPAQALFAALDKDVEASKLLSLAGMPARWWEPGLTGSRKMHIELGPRVYQVTCSASPLPGEDERLYIVAFLPMGRAALGNRADLTASPHIADPPATTHSSMVTPP